MFLRSVGRTKSDPRANPPFPYSVPILKRLEQLDFPTEVTFLVGENGSGKSTLMEAIACAMHAVTIGSESVSTDTTLSAIRKFASTLQLTWTKPTHRGFFLRAEDFFGYAKRIATIRAEAQMAIEEVDQAYEGRSQLAKNLAKSPHARTIGELESRYGEGLDAQSHGESFIKLFQSRLVPNGLYLLDEPEAPLSPLRQLAFLSLLKDSTAEGCQFIIATHSPILLAYPGARIMSCDHVPIEEVAYTDLDHYTLTRAFLNDPQQFLAHL